ncbi:hypothetical protein AXF24_12380 [Streptococcus pneumoniae]|nr:hypothetical protein AWW74_12395 [Streptococcus pneumoniae]KXB94839.1 hypothetical protein AXF24_12380 [Streptococcus pneumoniae]
MTSKVRKAVIPAAGLGTRFLPATKALAKERLPIVDKPTIQFIVEEALKSGIEDILVVTGKSKRSIEDHFDSNFELEYNLKEKGKTDLLKLVDETTGKAKGGDFDKLELLDRLLPLYGQIFQRLADLGVEWVQIDEPILVLDLPQAWKNAFERAYNLIQRDPLKKLVATYFGGLEENLGVAATLPVDGLHIDLVRAPEQYPTILDRLPAYKVLSLGVVNGRNVWRCDRKGNSPTNEKNDFY